MEIALWAGRWEAAYREAVTPEKRTIATVRAKKDMRRQVERIMREFGQQIKNTRGITFAEKVVLGLHLDDQREDQPQSPIRQRSRLHPNRSRRSPLMRTPPPPSRSHAIRG